jgi:hypothetical protein
MRGATTAGARKKRAQTKKDRRYKGKPLPGLSQLAPGMPALDSIKEVVDFVSPQNVKYKILKTTEMDGYDPVSNQRKKHSRPGTE